MDHFMTHVYSCFCYPTFCIYSHICFMSTVTNSLSPKLKQHELWATLDHCVSVACALFMLWWTAALWLSLGIHTTGPCAAAQLLPAQSFYKALIVVMDLSSLHRGLYLMVDTIWKVVTSCNLIQKEKSVIVTGELCFLPVTYCPHTKQQWKVNVSWYKMMK